MKGTCKSSKDGIVEATQLAVYIDNSVLLLLQDDPIQLGSCLENFGLLTPDRDVLCADCLHIIHNEIFDTSQQEAKSQKNVFSQFAAEMAPSGDTRISYG